MASKKSGKTKPKSKTTKSPVRSAGAAAKSVRKPAPAAKAASSKGAKSGPTAKASAAAKKQPAGKSKPPAKELARAASTKVAKDAKLAANDGKGAKAASKPVVGKITGKPSGKAAGAKGKKGAATGPVPDAQGYVTINGRRVRMISTKGLIIPKRSAAHSAAAEKNSESMQLKKPRKSKLSPEELEAFRELLLLRRRQLAGDLTAMESEALRSSGGNVSHMPIHMADIGTDTFDQDFMLGLAANERGLLKEIDDALDRIGRGEYGVCALTGQPIPKSRLNAKPWAKYTVEAARLVERGLTA